MSPKTTPRAPAVRASAPPVRAARARAARDAGASGGSSADSARLPGRDARSGTVPSYPRGAGRRHPTAARSAAAGARLAGAQQAVAQVGLLVGAGVPPRRVGQVVERGEAEELEEQRRRAVEHGAELRAARLLDQAPLEQRARRRVRADAADAGDL